MSSAYLRLLTFLTAILIPACASSSPSFLMMYSAYKLDKQGDKFPGGSEDKASACNAGDLGSIPGLGRSPGEGNGNPLQHSCRENPTDRGAWWATVHGVAKSWAKLYLLPERGIAGHVTPRVVSENFKSERISKTIKSYSLTSQMRRWKLSRVGGRY